MRRRGDIQYASRVSSPLFVKNLLQGVPQGLLQAATGTGQVAYWQQECDLPAIKA
jgi:hypothetical protein